GPPAQPKSGGWIRGRQDAFDLLGGHRLGQGRMPPGTYGGHCPRESRRNGSGAAQKTQKGAYGRHRLPTTDWLQFGRFTTNELHDRVPAEALPFNLGIPKTLLQQPT